MFKRFLERLRFKNRTAASISSPPSGYLEMFVDSGVVKTKDSSGTVTTLGGGGVSDGDKGDVTVASSGTVWTVDTDAITYAKIQNITTQYRILGRKSSGAGDVEEVTASEFFDFISTTRGALVTRGASAWVALAPGTSGAILTSAGSGADIGWSAPLGKIFSPHAAPSSPSSYDDEFNGSNGSSIDGKWSTWRSPTYACEGDGAAKIGCATSAGYNGYVQTLPSGDFTIEICVSARKNNMNGLVLGNSLTTNPTTGAFTRVMMENAGGNTFASCATYNNISSFNSNNGSVDLGNRYGLFFLRVVRATTYSCYWSEDGLEWHRFVTNSGLLSGYNQFGLFHYNDNANYNTTYGRVHWIRYVATADTRPGGALASVYG